MSDRIELPPTPGSVAVARRWSCDLVARSASAEVADTVALLVSELVTNVVLHARTPCVLSVTTSGRVLRVEVQDGSDRLPGPTILKGPMSLSGRGMLLVGSLSDRHGSERVPGGGKVVWFELELPQAPVGP